MALENLKHGDPIIINPEYCSACITALENEFRDNKPIPSKIPKRFCSKLENIDPNINPGDITATSPNIITGIAQAWRCKGRKKKRCIPKEPFEVMHGKLQCRVDRNIERFKNLTSCLYDNKGSLEIYDKRIKIKWAEEVHSRKKNSRRRDALETLTGKFEENKRSNKKENRKSRYTKLHSVGARCKFSIIPLSLFKDNFKAFLNKSNSGCRTHDTKKNTLDIYDIY